LEFLRKRNDQNETSSAQTAGNNLSWNRSIDKKEVELKVRRQLHKYAQLAKKETKKSSATLQA